MSQQHVRTGDDGRILSDGGLAGTSDRCRFGFRSPRLQASNSALEFAVLGRVDERVDAAVGEQQYHSEVVEPANESDNL